MLTQKRDRQGAWSSCLALTKVSAEDSEVEQIGSSPSGISAVQEEKKKKKNGKLGKQSREVGGQRPT